MAEAIVGALIDVIVGAAVGYAVNAVFGPGKSDPQIIKPTYKDNQLQLRSAVEAHKYVFGESLVSGPLIFSETNGPNNESLHSIVVLTGHEVTDIGTVYFDDLRSDGSEYSKVQVYEIIPYNLTGDFFATGSLILNGTIFAGIGYNPNTGNDRIWTCYYLIDDLYNDITGDAGYSAQNYTVTKTHYGLTLEISGKTVDDIPTVSIYNPYPSSTGLYKRETQRAKIFTISKHLGNPDQLADDLLVAENVGWTVNDRLRGRAYVYVRMTYIPERWPTGVPNIKAVVRGMTVYDPRTATWGWSDNAALCIRMHITSSFGINAQEIIATSGTAAGGSSTEIILGAEASTVVGAYDGMLVRLRFGTGSVATRRILSYAGPSKIATVDTAWTTPPDATTQYDVISSTGVDDDTFIAAANICDEWVLAASPVAISSSAAGSPGLIHTSGPHRLRTGDSAVIADHTGSTPSINGTHTVTVVDSDTVSIPTTITIGGTGGTIQLRQKRYTCNGVITAGELPIDVMSRMLTCCDGTLVYSEGMYKLYAGAYSAPVGSLSESDLRGGVRILAKPSRRNMFNGVRGTYIDPRSYYEETDFAPYLSETYKAQDDGEEIIQDVSFPFTNDEYAAQRLAKQLLEKSRRSMTIVFPAKYTAFELTVNSTINISLSYFGWVNKEFRLLTWSLSDTLEGVNLVLQEESADSYAWNNGDDTPKNYIESSLPSAFTIPTPENVSAVEELYQTFNAGNISSRIRVSWDASQDARVTSYYAFLYAFSDASATEKGTADMVSGSITGTEYVFDGILPGYYYVAVRASTVLGVLSQESDWMEIIVVGNTAPPNDVTGLVHSNGLLSWNVGSDPDRVGWVVRYRTDGGSDWTTATQAHNSEYIAEAQFDTGAVAGAVVKFLVKAIDSAANVSNTAISIDVDLRPAEPSQFSINVQADGTRDFDASVSPEPIDLFGFEIRYYPGSTSDWSAMYPLHTGIISAFPWETNQLAAGTYTFACKTVDRSGNRSAIAKFITSVELRNPRIAGTFESRNDYTLGFPSTKTSCHVDSKSGYLVADGSATWQTLPATWAGWTQWNYTPVSPIQYEILLDVGVVTAFTPLITVLSDGSQTIEEAHSNDGISYSSWAAAGTAIVARYIKIRVTITGSYPKIIDMQTLLVGNADTDYINDLDISTLTGSYRIGTGDIRLPLLKDFSYVRYANVSLQNVAAGWSWVLIDKDTTYGPRIKIYDASNTLADCTIDAFVDGLL